MKNNPDGSASMPVDEYGNNQGNNQSGDNLYPKPVSPSGYTKPGLTTHPLAYSNILKSLNSGSGAGIYNNEQ